jgi:hypothetical protein
VIGLLLTYPCAHPFYPVHCLVLPPQFESKCSTSVATECDSVYIIQQDYEVQILAGVGQVIDLAAVGSAFRLVIDC